MPPKKSAKPKNNNGVNRGIVAILDRRVLTKQYGRLFLESLPQRTARQGPAANLSREAGKWLGL